MNLFEKITARIGFWKRFVKARDTGIDGVRFLSFRGTYCEFGSGIDVLERVLWRIGGVRLCSRVIGLDFTDSANEVLKAAGCIPPAMIFRLDRMDTYPKGWSSVRYMGVMDWLMAMYPFARAGGEVVEGYDGVMFFPFGYGCNGSPCYGAGFPTNPVTFEVGSGEVVFDEDWLPSPPYHPDHLAAYYVNSGHRSVVPEELAEYYPACERGDEKIITLQQSRRAAIAYSAYFNKIELRS